ncbi:unnamed protein product [Acanthoscelides obtectus]|uniref:Uncharacterized protein n=1 Tax=Acanthoscelides obtectus TaxID=200917 RepID=A0A9P0KC50_ACAOB|nr:unnamed protein product [Acanthoscelides obtectus]CAK1677893.1 hypothetical protein AOBTE_LOCUS31624 [Acanthoscelides obtectus]
MKPYKAKYVQCVCLTRNEKTATTEDSECKQEGRESGSKKVNTQSRQKVAKFFSDMLTTIYRQPNDYRRKTTDTN